MSKFLRQSLPLSLYEITITHFTKNRNKNVHLILLQY